MPCIDSNSSYSSSSSGSSTSSLSSPRFLFTDMIQPTQQQQQPHYHQTPQTQLQPQLQQQQQQQQQQPAISSNYQRPPQTRSMKTTNHNTSPAIPQSHLCVTRYKTELCRPFTETGKCKYGDKCQFSHGIKELRILTRHPKYKTEYCRTFHTTGYCPYGPRCHFIHDIHEARTATQSNDFITRRHSDLKSNSSLPKSTNRNRINSDYTNSSSSQTKFTSTPSPTPSSSTKFPFSFEEINALLLSYHTMDECFPLQYSTEQQTQQKTPHHQEIQTEELFSSRLPALISSQTYRAFSSSSSSNSSLTPQYV